MVELAFLVIGLTIMLFISGSLSSSETALFSLPGTRVQLFAHSDKPKERIVATLLSRPQDLMLTILMLNITSNILIQNIVSTLFAENWGWLGSTIVPLLLTLIFGDAIPKSIGMVRSEFIALKAAPILVRVRAALTPIRFVLRHVTLFISRFFFFFLKKEKPLSLEELKYILHHSREKGVIALDELRLLCGYLELDQMTVNELMRPRGEILAYNLSDPIEKLIYLFVDQQCSKIPVYVGSLDRIVGVIAAHHVLLHREKIQKSEDLTPYMRKPLYVPEGLTAHRLLRRFEELEEKMALVVDEYGLISGLVTREDLLEVLVGPIEDKRDEESEYTRIGPGAILAKGVMDLKAIEDFFGMELTNPEHVATVGGWLISRLGYIPEPGLTYEEQGLSVQVLSSKPHRIETLFVQLQKEGKS